MSNQFKNFQYGISLIPGSNLSVLAGDLSVDTSNKLNYHDGSASPSTIVTENYAATLTNKSISLSTNTLTGTSAELKTAISDETGNGYLVFNDTPSLLTPVINSGAALTTTSTQLNYLNASTGTTGNTSSKIVFDNSPILISPDIGVAIATSVNKLIITAPASSATLTIADGKTLTASNTLTFTGTDSASIAFGGGGTVTYTSNKLSVFSSTTSAELAGIINGKTGFNVTGDLVFSNAPVLTSPEANQLKLNGSTSGTVTVLPTATTASYSITLPSIAPITGTGLYYDGSNYVWQALATAKAPKYDLIVGSSAQVTAGVADYSTVTAAISALSASGGSILVTSAYAGEASISINKDNVLIEGQGNLTVITGTLTFSATTDNSSVSNLRINGNVTFTSGCKYNFLTAVWISSSATLTDSGTSNYIQAIQE